MIVPTPLRQAEDEAQFGGKAISLGRSLRAGLPVPDGFALSVEDVDALAHHDHTSDSALEAMLHELGGRVAVRSSAVGEDAKDVSFAGQHLSVMNVRSLPALIHAIGEVRQSAHSASALGYRERMGIAGAPRIATVIQHLVESDSAGVLFTRNPGTGSRERLIEAAWGLGEIVVSGAVVPDSYRLDIQGNVLERTIGMKDVCLRVTPDGGTVEVAIEPARIHAAVLSDENLAQLQELTLRCESVFGQDIDIEWAFEGGRLYLLQCRSITRSHR